MSDGAKTGTPTPRTDGFRRSLQDSTGLTVPYFGALKLAYDLETALTEALNVAAEALFRLDHYANEFDASGDEITAKQMRSRTEEQRAALERIRNQSLS